MGFMSTNETNENNRPQTMPALLEDALERHKGEESGRAHFIEREGDADICRGCYCKIGPGKAIPFCEACQFDCNDVRYALCAEVLRLRALVDEADNLLTEWDGFPGVDAWRDRVR